MSGHRLVHDHLDEHLNLTTGQENSNLWTAMLSSSLGYLLPNPTLRSNGD